MSRVEDELEIRNLLARVSHITDGRGSLDDYLTLWTEDCSWSSPVAGSFTGHAGHLERHEKYRAAGVQGPEVDSFHLLTTVWVDVDGDHATSLSTWVLITQARDNPKVQDVGNYSDTLRRTAEGWKLVTRDVTQGAGQWLRNLGA